MKPFINNLRNTFSGSGGLLIPPMKMTEAWSQQAASKAVGGFFGAQHETNHIKENARQNVNKFYEKHEKLLTNSYNAQLYKHFTKKQSKKQVSIEELTRDLTTVKVDYDCNPHQIHSNLKHKKKRSKHVTYHNQNATQKQSVNQSQSSYFPGV